MSQDEPTSRKDKKALRDAERHKKGKKRKHAETEVQDVPAADDEPVDEAPAEPAKKSKKRKAEDNVEKGDDAVDGGDVAAKDAKPKKRKMPRTEQTEGGEDGQADNKSATKSRFIVFVGNLPYKTTDESLRMHFKKLQPFTLRHRTDPKTKKSKGFAFLEFENYDRMKTCLKLYHHSMFDPEDVKEDGADLGRESEKQEDTSNRRKKKSQARKINVELTAGGGGKTDARKEKIKVKNEKLEEERKRRAEAERKEKEKKARKEQKHGVKDKTGKKDEQEDAVTAGADASHGIHPSRLARMAG